MFERLNTENDRPIDCCFCGRAIPAGENCISLENETICRDCADRLELWQVLDMLELHSVIELFEEKGKTKRF